MLFLNMVCLTVLFARSPQHRAEAEARPDAREETLQGEGTHSGLKSDHFEMKLSSSSS
jgi:hypothetical protein